jgi:hypothetical protein
MVVLGIGVALAIGVVGGWCCSRAVLRIQAWGERMNECDRIFQAMEEGHGTESAPEGWALAARNDVRAVSAARALRPTAAGTK